MAITITLTEAEAEALRHIINVTNNGIGDNLEADEELGMDIWHRTHAALDTLEEKLDKKEFEEAEVARLMETHPNHPKSVIRKHVQNHIKENWQS